MSTWHRVFGSHPSSPAPAELRECVRDLGQEVQIDFEQDGDGWIRARLEVDGSSIVLERYLSSEEGIRADLNTWAAWVETATSEPIQAELMQRLIGTRQLIVLTDPPAEMAGRLCQMLARASDGVYQADGRGFFAADGTLLVSEA